MVGWKKKVTIPRNAVEKINYAVQPTHLCKFGYLKSKSDRRCVASQAIIMDAVLRCKGVESVSDEVRNLFLREYEKGLQEDIPQLSNEDAEKRARKFTESVSRAVDQTYGLGV